VEIISEIQANDRDVNRGAWQEEKLDGLVNGAGIAEVKEGFHAGRSEGFVKLIVGNG
jgi:hypothetical protein